MGLYRKLDLWSITESINNVIYYDCSGNEKGSPYWDYYEDQIRELAVLAADMYEELQQIKQCLRQEFPWKKNVFFTDDDCTYTEIAWWNTAACMLSDTDMWVLLKNEGLYGRDEFEEKLKRVRAFERLTKKQQMVLWTDVIGFIMRYLDLMAAFETISSVIMELDYHQSFIKEKGEIACLSKNMVQNACSLYVNAFCFGIIINMADGLNKSYIIYDE